MPDPAAPLAPSDRIREALSVIPEKVDLDSISQHFVKIAGGPAAIAKMLHDEYTEAEAGSATRARIMEMILRAFGKLDARGGAPDDLSIMSDDDLDRILHGQVTKIFGEGNGLNKPPAARGNAQKEAIGQEASAGA